MWVEGFKTGPDIDNDSRYNEVGPGYFSTLGIPVLQGREFTASDFKGAPRVAVVNQTFAKKFHIERNPVHTFMSFQSADSLNIEIVGLVQDAKYSEVKQPVPPLFFSPWRQEGANMLSFYVRTAVPPEQQLRAIPALLKRIAPTVPIEELKTMPQQIRDNVFLDRLISILSAVFAALATLLAAVGLYGVLAYTVQQRTREIGVRMALGADAGKVRALVVRQVGAMSLLGGVVGIGLALALGKLLQSLLYGLEAQDPAVFVMSLAVAGRRRVRGELRPRAAREPGGSGGSAAVRVAAGLSPPRVAAARTTAGPGARRGRADGRLAVAPWPQTHNLGVTARLLVRRGIRSALAPRFAPLRVRH